MLPVQSMLGAAGSYLARHPGEIVRAARSAALLRFGLPLDALRWVGRNLKGKKAPRDVQVEAVPPGLRVTATVSLMGNQIRAGATLFMDDVRLNPDEAKVSLRVTDVTMDVLEEAPGSPLPALLKSGALDLSRPGELLKFFPGRPDFISDASDNRITLDLRRHPKLAETELGGRILGLVTPFLAINGLKTDWDHLDVVFAAFPRGVPFALQRLRSLF